VVGDGAGEAGVADVAPWADDVGDDGYGEVGHGCDDVFVVVEGDVVFIVEDSVFFVVKGGGGEMIVL